ncbi:MAG: carboxypeptidase-like regulatory domain-containing protein, partial [Planctomycetota bacterium]|nr:carboxypeptidase-like regulatory domain-containing protein [Planctomycetota bacterium]
MRGIVKDYEGRPVPGARVLALVLDPQESFGQPVRILQATRSSRDGAFELHGSLLRVAQIVAHAPGYAWAGTEVLDVVPEPLTVLLAPNAGRIEGRVLDDATGLPIPGARVDLVADEDVVVPDLARSGQDGSFSVDGVSVGNAIIGVAAPDYVPSFVEVKPAAGEIERVVVRLKRGIRLHGTVRDGVTGDPIAGARISSSEWPARVAVTDKTGHYEFGGIGTEEDVLLGYILVRAPGHVPEMFDLQVRLPKGIDRYRFDIDCQRAAQIEAYAVDAKGQPMPGVAAVYLDLSGEYPGTYVANPITQTTDEDGRVFFDHMEPGTEGVLWLLATGCYDAELEFEPSGPGLVRFGRVELVPKAKTALLRGRVVSKGVPAHVTVAVGSHPLFLTRLGEVFVNADSTFEIQAPAKRMVLVQATSEAGESPWIDVLVPETGVTLEEPLVIEGDHPRREAEASIRIRFAGPHPFALLAKEPGGTWRFVDYYARDPRIDWPPGRCTFVAVGLLDVVSRPTTANIGDVTEVRLEGRGPTTDQTFVLVDRKGAPVRGVEVRIAARNAVEREWVFDW